MRDYRGKRIDDGRWVYGGLSIYNKVYNKDQNDHSFIVETYKDNLGFITRMQEVTPSTVGQYVGLNDRNGTKIYKDDIVLDVYGQKYIIIYDNSLGYRMSAIFKEKNHKFTTVINDGITVIGNIHDNQELEDTADD